MCGYNEYAYESIKCKTCPVGGDCKAGVISVKPGIFFDFLLKKILLNGGYWRNSKKSYSIYPCFPVEFSCL